MDNVQWKWKSREFFERGKPQRVSTGQAPLYTYRTKEIYNEIYNRIAKLPPPFDAIFELTEEGKPVAVVRVAHTDVHYPQWSINGGEFLDNSDYSKTITILQRLNKALMNR